MSAAPSRSHASGSSAARSWRQSLVAAARTVDPDRLMHSMHGYFLRPGDTEVPITFGVQRLRDGRSFSARRTHAYQNGVPILSLIASFQEPGEGLDHQVEMPEGIPDPESLPTTAELLKGIRPSRGRGLVPRAARWISGMWSPAVYFEAGPEKVARNAVWMKTFGPMPDDQNLHRAALAYASDYTLLESVLRRHGLAWSTPGMSVASLDHAMWWHRPLRVDDWLLYVQESPSASGARGLASGRIFNRAGELVATVAQEGMLARNRPAEEAVNPQGSFPQSGARQYKRKEPAPRSHGAGFLYFVQT